MFKYLNEDFIGNFLSGSNSLSLEREEEIKNNHAHKLLDLYVSQLHNLIKSNTKFHHELIIGIKGILVLTNEIKLPKEIMDILLFAISQFQN